MLSGMAAALVSILYVCQDSILYIPAPYGFPRTPKENPPMFRHPGEWTVKGKDPRTHTKEHARIPFEEVYLDTPDGEKIHCWLLLQGQSQHVPTLIYFHGNAGNMGFRLKNAAEMYHRVGANILMMDYRGYGNSTGKPTEAGLNIDAEVVLKYASRHPKLKYSKLIAFGRSLGGAVSVSLAHRFPSSLHGLVLENTFLSIPAMVDALMPMVSPLKRLVLRIDWDSEKKIQSLTHPIMFIAGEKDEIVPPSHMDRLISLAVKAEVKEVYKVAEGRHNDCFEVGGRRYYDVSYYILSIIITVVIIVVVIIIAFSNTIIVLSSLYLLM